MTSSYLKAMQLTKQLEEKAKEEKKNRQLADEEMLVVEEALDSAKAVDIDTVKAEEFLVKAQNSIEGKEYKDALSYATQATEAVKKEFSISIKSILDSAEGLLNLSKDIGADFSEGEALLSQAQSSLSEEKYDKALEQAKLSWVAFEKVALEHLSESFSKTQSMIMLARESGDDVAASEDLLKQARESMESQEYSVAYHRLKDCMESVGTGISSQVEELLDEAKGYQITAKELGADIDKIVEYVNRTEEEIESGKLEAAMSSARLSKSEAEKTLSRAISDNIELFNMSLVEAERIEADLTKSRELLDLVKTSLKNSNYIEAIDALNECESELHNTQFQRVLSTISQSRSKFVIANKIGADISEAMEYLNKAKESLKEGDFLNALEMAESGDNVVNGIIKEYEDIENTLSTLEEQVKMAKEMGADMSVVENSLLSAKEYLEQKEFDGVRESVGKTEDELNSALYAYATECIEIAELVISAGDKLGANLNEPELMMKDAITETKAGNFREAIELAASSTTRSEEIIKIHVSNTIASAELAIYDAENVDVDEVKGLIESAKVEFERNAFDRAFEYADKALNMLETGQSAKAREKVTELTKGLTIAKRMGCDIGSIDDVARKCNEYLNTRDFTSALVDAEKAYNDVKNLQYVAAERMFGEAKLSAIEAKKLGIDITDMREALKRAKLAFSKEDFEKTFKESQSAKMAAERQVNLHQKAYNSISQAAAMLAEAKKNQAEVKDAMAILVAARGLFEHFDYENALKEAEKAKEETEKLMNLFSAAGILNDSQEHVALLKGLEVDVSELEKHVEELTVLIKTKDSEKALMLAEELEAMTLHALEPAVNALISSTTSVIMDAKEVGIAVTAQEDKLEQAMSHLESLSFKEAVEDAIAVRDGVNKIKEMSQRAAVEIKNAQVKLGEGEPLHADMSKSKELLNSALNELKTANYEIAIKLAVDSVNESRKSIEKHVSETIKAFKVSIEKAKMEGMTVVAAEKLMDKAVGAFNNKDYKGSLSLAMKSEGELEKVGLQQEMAERAISTAENKLKETEGMGIHSKKASNILQQAREELRKGEYVRALEHAIQSGDELHNVSEEFQDANDTLGNLKAHIGMATNISADVSIAKKLLLDAESAMRDHDYRTATEIAKEGAIESRRLSHTALSTKISAAYKLIDLAAKSDLDVQGTSPMLAEAKTFMDTAKFEVSNEKIEYVMTDIKDKLNTHVNDMISQSERSMAHAKEVGAEITESEQLLSKAKTLLDQGRFRDALNLAEKSREAIDLKKGFEREFIELTYEAEKVISNSKKFGINVKEAEAMFKTAREQKEVNYQTALETLKRSIETVRTAVQEFIPKLTASLSLTKVEKGVWVDTELALFNQGKALAKNVTLNFLGDVSIQGDLKLDSVRGVGGEEVLPVKLKFDNLGDMPVIVKMQSTRLMDGAVFHNESVVNVYVYDQDTIEEPSVGKAQFVGLKAQADTKCNICMGKIKAGLEIVKCNCGGEYHAMCIKRFEKCTGCGTAYSEDKLGTVEKEEDTIGDLDAPVKTEEDGDKLKKDGVIVESEPATADEEGQEEPEEKLSEGEPPKKEPPESQSKEKGEEPKKPTKKRFALRF